MGRTLILKEMRASPCLENRSIILTLMMIVHDFSWIFITFQDLSWWWLYEQVGHTTSGCYSPLLGSALAMASVPPMFAVPGTELKVKPKWKGRLASPDILKSACARWGEIDAITFTFTNHNVSIKQRAGGAWGGGETCLGAGGSPCSHSACQVTLFVY